MKLFRDPVFLLAALTLVHPAWLELVGLNFDHGDGSFETLIVLVCIVTVLIRGVRVVRRLFP